VGTSKKKLFSLLSEILGFLALFRLKGSLVFPCSVVGLRVPKVVAETAKERGLQEERRRSALWIACPLSAQIIWDS
jgi:hypothetical protein